MNGLQACCCCCIPYLCSWDVGGFALNSHGNYIVDRGKSWKNPGIVLLNFCGNPANETLEIMFLSVFHLSVLALA